MTIPIFDLLVTSAGILVLIAFWQFMWRPLSVAHLRQDLFDARDSLFDMVASGEIQAGFDSPIYRCIRADLNRLIRYSHKVSMFQSIMGSIFLKKKRASSAESVDDLVL